MTLCYIISWGHIGRQSLDLWLGEDEVGMGMVVREGPSPTCQVTRLH